jgi:hypothetical protein
VEHVSGGEEGEAFVVVFLVVPAEEGLAVGAAVEQRFEAFGVSTIALSDPRRIGETGPAVRVAGQGQLGWAGLSGVDRPNGSTRLSGWFIMLRPRVDCSSWICGGHRGSGMTRLRG